MKVSKDWVRFNFEYAQWVDRQARVEQECGSADTLRPEIREWARGWLAHGEDMAPLRKGGYLRSWLVRVSELLGEAEAHDILLDMIGAR